MNFRIPLLSLVLLSLLSGCGYKLVRKGELNAPYYDSIKTKVSAERGLPWLEDVEVRIINREQVRAMLEGEMDKEFSPEKAEELQRAYVRMGLIDAGTDLREVLLGFLTGAGAGFYDPEEKVLYLVKEVAGRASISGIMSRRDMTAELVVAHELGHALDDQHFDLFTLGEEFEENDDAALAITALEEGSATIVGFAVIYKPRLTMEEIFGTVVRFNALNKKLMGLTSPSTPSVVRDMLLFGYGAGSKFIEALYISNGGWDEVNAAFKNPPISTEEVLHPDKYLVGDDRPRIPELAITASDMGDGWIELDRNTVGEYGIQLLMGRFIKKDKALAASEGWGGDKYVVVESPDGEIIALVWITKWDTEEDAFEFDLAYRHLLMEKYKVLQAPTAIQQGIGFWMAGDEGLVWMRRIGDEVIIIEGADATALDIIHKKLGIE